MSGEVEVFLDEAPGEIRGVIRRDGYFHRLLIEREDDVVAHRLGSRSVGRVAGVEPGLKAAFVDLGEAPPFGFLPLRKDDRLSEGQKVEVVVTAEPRSGKGPTLKLVGAGQGAPRLLEAGPGVAETLARLAPGVTPTTGPAAIQASWDAEEDAGFRGEFFEDIGLDLAVERTRALIAVDLDLAPMPGRRGDPRLRDQANRRGLFHAARLIGLKRWGGLVAVDLVGVGHDGEAVGRMAREAFGADPEIAPEIVYGPVNRFGVLQLALPWRRTPLEEVFNDRDGKRRVRHRAQDIVRSLRMTLLADTSIPRIRLRCAPEEAALAQPLAARLGLRALVVADPDVAPRQFDWEEG